MPRLLSVVSLALVLFVSCSYAESTLTCPSIASVKTGRNFWPNGPWLPLYTNNHELAMSEDVVRFQKEIHALSMVEWNAHYLETGHCYYAGNNTISLARDMLLPLIKLYPLWVITETDYRAVCVSQNEEDCPFGGVG